VHFEFTQAFRYLRAGGKRLARLTAVLAVVGIACGVAALIFAQALGQSFEREILTKILSHTPHISVFRQDGGGIENQQAITELAAKTDGVRSCEPTSYESALLTSDAANSYAVLRVKENLGLPPDSGAINVAVGAELAQKMKLAVGDAARITAVEERVSGDNIPRSADVKISEIFRTGMYDYDSTWVYLSFADYKKLYENKNLAPPYLTVSLDEPNNSRQIAENLRGNLGAEFKVVDWQQANRPFFAALQFERRIVLALIALIVLLAALNITTTLVLNVAERRMDIAVLRNCGAQTAGIVRIFLLQGSLLGLTGIFIGVVLGLAAIAAANYFGLAAVPPEVYAISEVKIAPGAADILLPVGLALLLTVAATVYPALSAAKIKPWENLRQ
jgi:lipoprotein-releasing system permease protein